MFSQISARFTTFIVMILASNVVSGDLAKNTTYQQVEIDQIDLGYRTPPSLAIGAKPNARRALFVGEIDFQRIEKDLKGGTATQLPRVSSWPC